VLDGLRVSVQSASQSASSLEASLQVVTDIDEVNAWLAALENLKDQFLGAYFEDHLTISRMQGNYLLLPMCRTDKPGSCTERHPFETWLDDSGIQGVSLRLAWERLEQEEGVFDWSHFDDWIRTAKERGKKVTLRIHSGIHAPQWVFDAIEAQSLVDNPEFKQIVDFEDSKGPGRIPLPWNRVMLEKWENVIRVLGERYGDNDTVVSVHMTGPIRRSSEMHLPKPNELLNGETWEETYGYTPDKLISAWDEVITAYAEAFEDKALVLNVQTPIRNDGVIEAVIAQARTTLGPRAVFQHNVLSPQTNEDWFFHQEVSGQQDSTLVGFQAVSPARMPLRDENGDVVLDENGRWIYTVNPRFNGTIKEAYKVALRGGASYFEPYIISFGDDVGQAEWNDAKAFLDANFLWTLGRFRNDAFEQKVASERLDAALAEMESLRDNLNEPPPTGPPLALDQAVDLQEDSDWTLIQLDATDASGAPLTLATYQLLPNPSFGEFKQFDATAGTVLYRPSLDFNGLDSFQYTVTAGQLTSAPATVDITINPVNDAPVAALQSVTVDEDSRLGITLEGTDVDGDDLVYSLVEGSRPANGILNCNGSSCTYTPNLNFHGLDSFQFTVSDGELISEPALVTIIVQPENDLPLVQDPGTQEVLGGEAFVLQIDATDPDGDELVYGLVTAPDGMAISTTGLLTWQPTNDQAGVHSVTVSVSDGVVEEPVTVHFEIRVIPLELPRIYLVPKLFEIVKGLGSSFDTFISPRGDATSFNSFLIEVSDGPIEVSRANILSSSGIAPDLQGLVEAGITAQGNDLYRVNLKGGISIGHWTKVELTVRSLSSTKEAFLEMWIGHLP